MSSLFIFIHDYLLLLLYKFALFNGILLGGVGVYVNTAGVIFIGGKIDSNI